MKLLLAFGFLICCQEAFQVRIRHRNRGTSRNHGIHMRDENEFDNEAFANHTGDWQSLLTSDQANSTPSALYPALLDVAPIAEISANATCGGTSHGSEEFCKQGGSSQCSICSSSGTDVLKKHLISYAIDSDSTNWWQSPTLAQGPQYEYVTITLDLRQTYYIWYIIIKCANSPRPENWILERSIDGVNYSPWQYFIGNEDDCWQKYSLPTTSGAAGSYAVQSDDEVLCSTFYSKIKPLEGGEIHAFIAKGRPGCISSCTVLSTKELREFSIARFLRFRFQKFSLTKEQQSSLSDPFVQKRLFYSIKKISIGAQCICHGHAGKCKRSHDMVPYCECSHNTCGINCERCCPLYNQISWKEATHETPFICEPCQCHGHATACRYDSQIDATNSSLNVRGEYRGGGVCINCTKHTTGINCEKCDFGWYRPSGVRPDDDEPCRPCDCHQIGSTGLCLADDSSFSKTGEKAGTCECLEGFNGMKCDRCAPGYYNFPNCEKCNCDASGTEFSESCEKHCICKANVVGEMCNKCKPGYFNLSPENPLGCKECFCSGISTTCTEAKDFYSTFVRDNETWSVVSLNFTTLAVPDPNGEENLLIVSDDDVSGDVYYWSAPKRLIGNILTSYGMNLILSISWNVRRGDTSGKAVFNPDVILIGGNGLELGYNSPSYENNEMMLNIKMTEDEWYLITEDLESFDSYSFEKTNHRKGVTRREMLSVMSDVKHLIVRAKFHTDQSDCSLVDAVLEFGTKEHKENKSISLELEQCVCPAGYTGLLCERCDYGYVRLPAEDSFDHLVCSLCDCNGHSPTCNEVTGQCNICEHNTTGSKCDRCVDGFYGNAELGTSNDCHLCACPLLDPTNNFSPTCKLVNNSSKEYYCDKCPPGYGGNHCDVCADGYFGEPTKLGSKCEPCDCAGRACNSTTGQCLSCEGNTEGWHCETCKDGFYGNAASKNCTACTCNSIGSESIEVCDKVTGQCSCKMNYVGRTCDRCLDGYGNVESGCIPCNCNIIGSQNVLCDPVTGNCPCKKGVVGVTCDSCAIDFYGFPSGTGCKDCKCNETGSLGTTCEPILGHCPCKKNIIGRTCDQCEEGFWDLTETGCKPCECDAKGSVSQFCDLTSGQCTCKFGVTGRKCDQCKDHFYGFSNLGCFECDSCDKPGHICNKNNGRCVCPSLTQGPSCEKCIPSAWNYTEQGCQPCECDSHGSKSSHCKSTTGKCECRTGFGGDKCDTCAKGYYGFPKCRLCSCNRSGTDPETCNGDGCMCDNKGQCYCKVNSMGKKCDQCKEGTFGLHEDNIDGCTACFCFGRSTLCSEAGLTWSHIRLRPNRILTVHYDTNNTSNNLSSSDIYPVNTQQICFINLALPGDQTDVIKTTLGNSENNIKLNVTNNLRLIPGETGDIEIGVNYLFDAPLYWQLPESFLGDRILSYGGFIQFTTEIYGGSTLLPSSVIASYPLIQIQGNDKFILEYFPPLITSESRHKVRLHESLWKLKNNPTGHVSRDVFMITLQNLQHILIRATKSVDFTKATLTDVSMDIAVENFSPLPPLQSITYGVELCECPVQYRSSSCQNPEIGYYRYHGNKTTVTSTIVIQVVGEAMPCECNGYSTVCEPESGVCQNCSNNTGGPHCESCAEGYYKSDQDGSCKLCPCPTETNNHAYTCYFPTTVNYSVEYATCYCKTGYTGRYCDRCNYGWFGYPKSENGYCEPCKCNTQGSVSDECHEETGQCNCKPGITSRDCSICEKSHQVLTNKGCQPCNDTCVQMLTDAVANMTSELAHDSETVLQGKFNLPWSSLNSLNENFDDADNTFQSYLEFIKRLAHYNRRIEDELKKKVKSAINKIKRIWKHNQNLSSSTKSLNDQVISFLNSMSNVQDDVASFIDNLNKYVSSERVDYNLGAYVNEARYLLANIKDANPYNLKEKAESTLSFCKMADEMVRSHENNGPGLKLLKKRVDKMMERVEDLDAITSNASLLIRTAYRYSYDSRDKLQWIREASDKINQITLDVLNTQAETNLAASNTSRFFQQTRHNIQDVNSSLRTLKELIRLVEEKEGILFNLNPTYADRYVNPAIEHARVLLNRAKNYVSLFAATKQDADIALGASTAYRRIVDAYNESRQALNAVNKAIDELRSKQMSTSITEKAGSMEEKSRQLKTLAAMELSDVNLLQKQLEYQQKYVHLVEKNLQEIVKNVTNISDQLININRTKEAIRRMNESLEMYKNSIEIPDDVYEKMFYVQDNINDEIKPKLQRIKNYGEINIKPTDEMKIKEIEEATMEMSTRLNSLKTSFNKRTKYFEKWNSTVASQLAALRSKIEQAKHIANGVHVSLSSKNGQELCMRSYQSKYLKPSITNYISITYAISSHHRDSLLFYLSSSTSGDFLAVEMINRKIRFVWDVGGGPTELIHPLHIQTAGDLQKDQHWYKIEIRRIANVGKLSVRPVTSNSALNGSPVTNSSVSGWSRLDISTNDLIWIGGSGKPVSPYLLSKQNGLIGCLSQVIFDNKLVGLWNFKSETVGSCVACVEGTEEIIEDDSYHFTGDGYSVLKGHGSSVYNKYVFTASFNFKTYDENAVLFYAVASKPEQFISITMKDGRVLVQIGYREDLKLEIRTTNRYTTGNWTHVEMVRQYDRKKKLEKVALKVGSELKEGIPAPSSPAQNDIPDLSTPQFFIGGSPPGFETIVPLPGPFLGCISDVQINQEAYNLLRGQYWGVQKACSNTPVTVVGFQGNGYLELGSYPLQKSSSFYFVFSTNQLDAFLILSTTEGFPETVGKEDGDDESETNAIHYYSVALREGRIELVVNVGTKDTKLISRGDMNYSDGQFHAVNVIKTGKRLELRVDDIIQAIGFMPEDGSSTIRAAGVIGGLFLGGVPSDITFNVTSVSDIFLFGTIKDVIFDDRLIHFARPVEFERALIGRIGPKMSAFESDAAALTQSTQGATGANSCQKSYTYSVQPFAVQFGDLPKSYVRLDYDRYVFHQKNSTIELTFRTFYLDGVLLMIPGSDDKQDHYLKVFLFGGKIIVLIKGKRRLELQIETSYDDGNWHNLKLVRDGKNLHLFVDKSHSQKVAIPKKLHFQNTLFIGGFSNDIRIFDPVFDKIEALKGCIKEVIINGKKEDLVGDRAKHHHVGQCFPNVERGAYFSGDSYAVAVTNFSIGTSLQFELEFRTTEMNGILMLHSEPDGYPSISLELIKGKVVLNGDMGDRRPFKVELEFSSIYHLCDNEWHQVKVNFVEEEISLHVDNTSKMYWLSDNGHITEAHTNSPLYIGGIPEHAAKKIHANKENFKGCMRNAFMRGSKLEWIELPTTHNVLLSSCPV
ncbi:laminin subunit alpha lam-3-like [Planococcus citri]|uniref:laminin subunit alpha lam-3-like n=1 Tax=Planococcus citri TaxID=170843 RepID=UPI0031F757B3